MQGGQQRCGWLCLNLGGNSRKSAVQLWQNRPPHSRQ